MKVMKGYSKGKPKESQSAGRLGEYATKENNVNDYSHKSLSLRLSVKVWRRGKKIRRRSFDLGQYVSVWLCLEVRKSTRCPMYDGCSALRKSAGTS